MDEIRKAFEEISGEEKKRLMMAFEAGRSDYIEYAKGKFLGCNIRESASMHITEIHRYWSIGEIKCG